jgi:hypothetical protein
MGDKLKSCPGLVFWAAGEACFMGSPLRHQYLGRRLRRLRATAHADSAIRDGVSETATFANGWLTKMIKTQSMR